MSWTYSGGSVATPANALLTQKNGTGTTALGTLTGSGYPVNLTAQPSLNTIRSALYFDLTKTTPSSVTGSLWFTATAPTDVTRYQHLANMDNETLAMTATVTHSITSAMLWDTAFVSWGRSAPVIEIDDITVLRYY